MENNAITRGEGKLSSLKPWVGTSIAAELNFDVNISILFTELPLLERPAATADAGFGAVELWWPFDVAVPRRRQVDQLVAALDKAGVKLVALNCFAGDMTRGERGLVSWPERSAEFRESVPALLDIAERTGCRRFNALYGQRLAGVDPLQQEKTATENLAFLAQAVAAVNGIVLVEALASGENGAYPLLTSEDVETVIRRVHDEAGVSNVAFLADFYHLARNGGSLHGIVCEYGARLGHVQIADVPGRHQPGTGELPFDELLQDLIRSGYTGWVGLEYRPDGPSGESFKWLR